MNWGFMRVNSHVSVLVGNGKFVHVNFTIDLKDNQLEFFGKM